MNRSRISYAQNNEDIIIDTILRGLKKGFYIDVGANHPSIHSVTKVFYDRGWRGMNIEPSPRMFKLLEKERPRDINLNIGVAEKSGILRLRIYHTDDQLEGLSTFSPEMKKEHHSGGDTVTQNYSDISVPVESLSALLQRYVKEPIAFMKVDVEGLEYDVLAGNDWRQYRPSLLCIESNHIVKDWRRLVKSAGYVPVYTDGLNSYFVAREALTIYARKDLGAEIVEALYGSIKAHHLGEIQRIKSFEHQQQDSVKEIARQHLKIGELEAGLDYLKSQIEDQRKLTRQLKNLYATLDSKVMNTIEYRGRLHKKKMKVVRLPKQRWGSIPRKEVLAIAREHDAKKYLRYLPQKNSIKLRYRLARKAYVITTHSAKKGARGAYLIVRARGGAR